MFAKYFHCVKSRFLQAVDELYTQETLCQSLLVQLFIAEIFFIFDFTFSYNYVRTKLRCVSNLTEVAELSCSPISNDALRRVTSEMLKLENENPETNCEQVINKDNEQSIEREPSTSTPIGANETKKPQEVPIHAKIGSYCETPEAGSSQALFNLLQELCQYETASGKDAPAFEKAPHFLVILPQNADLHLYGPEDPLRKQQIVLFHQVCDRMRYIPHGEFKQLSKAQGASDQEASIMTEKAVKKVSNLMKCLGF